MKILTASEMKAADEATLSCLGIPSRVLMENAGRAVADFLIEHFSDRLNQGVVVITGRGNNGGDGFVTARVLHNRGVNVTVLALDKLNVLKGDAKENAIAYQKSGGKVLEPVALQILPISFVEIGLIVDAIYGTGFRGELPDAIFEGISELNSVCAEKKIPIVAIDIPSGIDASTGKASQGSIRATTTVALQSLKIGHVLFPGARFCGDIFCVDIGVFEKSPEYVAIKRELITPRFVSERLRESFPLDPETHKGKKGHVLVIGGGRGHYGAPRLAGDAALVTGAGLVTLLLPQVAARILGPSLLELMCAELESDPGGDFSGEGLDTFPDLLNSKQALVVGPGLGQGPGAEKIVRQVLTNAKISKIPLVIDADALNIIAKDPTLPQSLPENSVLTPHPGEMARLLSTTTAAISESRLEMARELSAKWKVIVVLKGARTIVACPDGETFINLSATPVLATAGAGDVLSGVIGAFLAMQFSPKDAACAGVFVHGSVGENLVKAQGPAGLIAGDIVRGIPAVINQLLGGSEDGSGNLYSRNLEPVLRSSLSV